MIEFTLLDGYPQLLEAVKAYGYDLIRRHGEVLAPEEIAAAWYDTEYLPGVDALRRASLPEKYAPWGSTDSDLFLWIYQRRRDLRAMDPSVDFDAAARDALTIKLGGRQRRDVLRDGRRPLPRRDEGGLDSPVYGRSKGQ